MKTKSIANFNKNLLRHRRFKRDDIINGLRLFYLENMERRPTLDDVADVFCVSPRTLTRRLNEVDITYRAIMDEARKEKAENLLANSEDDIHVIAKKIGFRDPSNFSKAFMKWVGVTPRAYRKRNYRYFI